MLNADTQCTVEGREEAQMGREKIVFQCCLSCLKIRILFHQKPRTLIGPRPRPHSVLVATTQL